MEDEKSPVETAAAKKREANAVIAIGAGVGALGAGAALVAGAVCPLCVVIAPGLIGMGIVARVKASRTNVK